MYVYTTSINYVIAIEYVWNSLIYIYFYENVPDSDSRCFYLACMR